MNGNRNIRLFYPVRTLEMEQSALESIRSGLIASGPAVEKFEHEFGHHIGKEHVVAINDMTNALTLALRLAGVKPNDRVATMAFSCLSTNAAIAMVGAIPVWVDMNPTTLSMCPDNLLKKLTDDIKAVLLYYVAGYPAETEALTNICKSREIPLIEDCNNALGTTVNGQQVGRHGRFAIYSFYPNRQINALEGGALVCPDAETATHAKRLRRFGVDYTNFRDERGEINPNSDITEIGISASFSQLNAAIAQSQLATLTDRQRRTNINASRLSGLLENVPGISLVRPLANSNPSYWCFVVLAHDRDRLLMAIKNQGIQCSILHHRNDTYSGFNSQSDDLSGTSYVMDHIIALPCGWWLDDSQINSIANTIAAQCQI